MKDRNELVSIFAKGALGAIPFVGPLAAEIIGMVIPNKRLQRIEALLTALESKIQLDKQHRVAESLNSENAIDLMEDAFIAASRALSSERIDYIASMLKNGLTRDELEHIEYKRLMSLLSELNDVEVLILKSKLLDRRDDEFESFWKKHQAVLIPATATFGSTREEIDKNTVFQSHKTHLRNLGLIKTTFKKPKRGELPEFDEKTGMIKAQGEDITPLGRLLLESIDQAPRR
ncbi:hypothetical protein JX580_06525 [Thiomicrospira microaerophila]|uniref:hypothetical protein n=1 Tax=Thiomicrospira microaerophila TaxID=406020 RepID=UPI00200CF3DB|nr:hypothetical protein [Thiomicrospira microaerophila]UQB41354.1 hypothetical protein JX580_06525 [Thiomicrospira microaerophila]